MVKPNCTAVFVEVKTGKTTQEDFYDDTLVYDPAIGFVGVSPLYPILDQFTGISLEHNLYYKSIREMLKSGK